MKIAAKEIISQILKDEYCIENVDDLYAQDGVAVAILYENLKPVQEEYDLSDEDMGNILNEILTE